MRPIEKVTMPGSANEKVIELFKRWLERAEQGKLNWAAICVSEHPTHNVVDYSGAAELTYAGYWGLDILKDKIRVDLMSRYEITKDDFKIGSQVVQFDMSQGPACFDFVAWLVVSEMNRRRASAAGPLKVCFTMSLQSEAERELHKRAREKFINNVCRRVLHMIGAEEVQPTDAPMHKRFTFAAICEYHKQGETVPLLKPSDEAGKAVRDYLCGEPMERGYVYQPPVTITLREVDYWPHRNSNLEEWIRFARYLEAQGERVIFIRDTAKADEPIEGFETCPSAATDIDVRQALYEAAKCNMFVSNGPWTMAVFGTRPYLMFVEVSSMSPFHPETPQFWRQWHGIDEGEQLPWRKDFQTIVWKRDDYKNLVEAWELYGPRLEHHVAA